MKIFHIDEFKCTLCSNWFCPPFNLPYRLKCTHSICTTCLEKSVQNCNNQIICPEDLEKNKISQISINHSTKKALERLLRQHKNFIQTNHLECIKSLSVNFDELLNSKQIEMKNLSTLIDQTFQNQIKRLRQIYEKIKIEINRPFRIVNDWKQVVRNYLKKVKTAGPNLKGCVNQLNHYIEEGRKIKLDLGEYLKFDFRELIDHLLMQPQVCFTHHFSIFNNFESESQEKYCSASKFETLGKRFSNRQEIQLQDVTNNFEQSSIRVTRQNNYRPQQNSNKLSLFEDLIQETPQIDKSLISNRDEDTGKTQLKEMIFSTTSEMQDENWRNGLCLKNVKKAEQIQTKLESQNKLGSRNKVGENLNEYGQEQVQREYNSKIREKIRNLKGKQVGEQGMKKRGVRMGKSLEYSPEELPYSSEGLPYCPESLQQYAVNDSFQQIVSSYPLIRNNNISIDSIYQDQTSNGNQSNSLRKYTRNESTQKKPTEKLGQFNEQELEGLQEEMLLDEKPNKSHHLNSKPQSNNHWQLENLNFLKEWKLNKNQKPQQELEIIQKYGHYDSEKQKNKYVRKIEENNVKLILNQTNIGENFIEIVGVSLTDCNLNLFLAQVDWNCRNIQIIKFIKTSLNDHQLNQLLNFVLRSNVHTLMLSYNNLSQLSLDALLNFVQMNKKLKNIYLPKNNISLLKGNSRTKINLLKEKGINLYI